MKGVLFSMVVTLGATAQNLVGVDFESASAISTANWPLQTAGNSFGIVTTTQHCGTASAQVGVGTTSNWCEFGKQWYFHTGITQTLRARVRVKAPLASGAQLRLAAEAWAYPVTSWSLASIDANHLPGSTDIDAALNGSNDWQTFELSYTPPSGNPPTGPTLVRLWFLAINLGGKSFHVDSVDFTGSGPAYEGGVAREQTCARAVTSTRLTMVYDSDASTKRVRDLRNTRPNSPVNIAADQPAVLFAENLLREPSGLDDGSDLYKISYRATVNTPDSGITYGASRWHSLNTVTASQVGTGWRFVQGWNDFTATVDVYTLTGRPEIFLDPVVTRPSAQVLEAFMCPWLEMATTSDGNNADSRCIRPKADGVLVHTDSAFFNALTTTEPVWISGDEYPGGAALQLMGIYDDDAGAALASYDITGENKLFLLQARKTTSSCDISIFHRVPSLENTTAAIANVQRAILPCVGTWMDAAEQYRDWIDDTSLWTAAANRTEAAWVASRPTIFLADLTPQGMGKELVPIDDWDQLMNDWASQLGSAMVPLFVSFEQNGVFAGPDYLPLRVFATDQLGSTTYASHRTETEIHQAWQEVQTEGHHGMVMVASLKWAKSRPGAYTPRWHTSTNYCSPAPDETAGWWIPTLHAPVGTPWAGLVIQERNKTTGVFQDLLQPAGASWDTDHYFMDPQLANTQSVHSDLAAHVANHGIQAYLFDQMNGGAVADNFRGNTGGAGAWKVASIRTLFMRTLAEGRAANPDFELAIEDPCEQSIDLIALQGTRPDKIRAWPALPDQESRTVPLFQYVFSEVISPITWGIPMPTGWFFGNASTYDKDPLTLRQTCYWQFATTLASGSWLATEMHSWMLVQEHAPTGCTISNPNAMEPTWNAADPDVRNFLAACVKTTQGPAATFMNDGRMVRTSSIVDSNSPIGTSEIYQDGFNYTTVRREPSIVHAAWQIPNSAARAVLFANIDQTTPYTVLVPETVGTHTVGIGTQILRFDNGAHTATFGYSPTNPTISVPPRTVVLLVF